MRPILAMPLVETRAPTAEMRATKPTTTISVAWALGDLWAYPIDDLAEGPSRGRLFQWSILRVLLAP
jgi:hypothetical protein